MDVSNTGFAELIDQDPDHFHSGPLEETSCSGEFFSNNNQELWDALNTFKSSDADHIYLTSNLGDWNRHSLPEACRIFGGAFFQFNKTVTNHSDPYTENGPFEVVHIRTGDIYMSRGDQHPKGIIDVSAANKKLQRIIEDSILIESKSPIIIMSDSVELKQHLAQRYGFKVLPHAAEHAAYGGTLETCIDLQILKRSSHNYGINIRHIWWSGFTHYTSLIFNIPSTYYRLPYLYKESISSSGEFSIPFYQRLTWKTKRMMNRPGYSP